MLSHLIATGIIVTGGGVPPVEGEGPVSIAEARKQCRVFNANEDIELAMYIAAGVGWVSVRTGLDPMSDDWPALAKIAVLLIVGEFYTAREIGSLSPSAISSAHSLIEPYLQFAI